MSARLLAFWNAVERPVCLVWQELESEKEVAQLESASLAERLSAAIGEAKAMEGALTQAEEVKRMMQSELNVARARTEAAENRADKFNRQRASAQEEAAGHVARISALEAAVVAAAEASRASKERLKTETAALRTHIEYAEERCADVERRRDALVNQLESGRKDMSKMQSALHRASEQIMEEQVRASVAEERWQPLIRQRDDAQKERARAARALSAVRAEKRELEWAVSDLGRRGGGGVASGTLGGSAGGSGGDSNGDGGGWGGSASAPLRAWEPLHGVASRSGLASAAAAGLAVTPYPPRSSSFQTSPYGRSPAATPTTSVAATAGRPGADAAADLYSDVPLRSRHGDRYTNAERNSEQDEGDGSVGDSSEEYQQRLLAKYQQRLAERLAAGRGGTEGDVSALAADVPSGDAIWSARVESDPWEALAEAHSELDRKLDSERAVADAAHPDSTPWAFV